MENETVFAKMADELKHARNSQYDHDQMIKHISHIQLLCELFLEQKPKKAGHQAEDLKKTTGESEHFTKAELQTMLGNAKPSAKPAEEDGMSIFDF